MFQQTFLIETSMTIYTLSEPISITEILDRYKINQDRYAILALIMKSGFVQYHKLLPNEMFLDVIMSKHCGHPCYESDKQSKIYLWNNMRNF